MTPRVRTIVVCDDVTASLTEEKVFTLDGVRHHLEADVFPWRFPLNLFLLLSSPRRGKYFGKVLIVNQRTDKAIRYVKFVAEFHGDNELLPLCVDIGDFIFPESGQFDFEIYFSAPAGGEAVKGELPFIVIAH